MRNQTCCCQPPKAMVVRTSWTTKNPGRRFASCINYKNGGCSYFDWVDPPTDWVDPPICAQSNMVIPRLIRRISRLEDEISAINTPEILSGQHQMSHNSYGDKGCGESVAESVSVVEEDEEPQYLKRKCDGWIFIIAMLFVFVVVKCWI
ncbi:uncharacterized protein LOC133820854 [Humulus lupulus]|uniref:uncharacterized protein LOC133820854 n=1 Tax=Humulus lupulus TaxID=3486 RepID=UPI002B40E499|nr:uncharacterized protein LOC133820854 [Humulus lupulus]